MKFKSNLFYYIEKLNDLWNFEINIHIASIGYARAGNHREIADILSKGPIKTEP